MLSAEDHIAIQQLIATCSHMVDNRRWEELPLIYTDDGIFDATTAGYPAVEGQAALLRHMESANHPVAHYTTNTVLHSVDADAVTAVSMIIAPWPNGEISTGGTYHDHVVRTPDGWRIKVRKVVAAKGYVPR